MLTKELISPYLVKDPPKHQYYNDTVKIANELQIHSKGKEPTELLNKARPNEEEKYKQWRLDRWSPKTKVYFGKVVTNYAKIRKAEDWSISYKSDSRLAQDLKKYMEKDFPDFDSFDNWAFSYAFSMIFDDPNRVVAVYPKPKRNPGDDTEVLKPFPFIFNSEKVIEYVESEFAVLESDEKSIVKVGDSQVREGKIYYFFDRDSMIKAVQVGEKEEYKFEIAVNDEGQIAPLKHNIGHMPVWKIGGLIKEFGEAGKLFESFISPAIPSWDEAIMDYSDHQVNKAIHLHPDRWEIADVPCKACKETGYIEEIYADKKHKTKCSVCHGNGNYSVKSPFNTKFIKPSVKQGVNDYSSIPTPPMGYADRPIETLDFNKKEYFADIREGLAAINMEFVMDEPQENSGVAKALDRDPITTGYYMIGKHLIENLYIPCHYFIAKWRYGKITSEDQIMEIVPNCKVPEKYDVIISSILAERAVKAREKGMNPAIVSGLEISYARKEFGEGSTVPKIMETVAQLDPLFGKTEDEKMVIFSNGGCTDDQYILSSQIYSFVNWAISDDDKFLEMDYKKKFDVLNKYVQEVKSQATQKLVPIVDVNGQNAA